MIRIYVFSIFMLLGLNACTNMDRVAPMSWTYYLSNGVSEAQIRPALLECGHNVPGDFREYGRHDVLPLMPFNHTVLVMKCMQNAGFTNSEFGDACNRWKDLPACKPDAVIPKRSVANRISSPFCQIYSKIKICQPDYDSSKVEPSVQTSPKPISIAPSIDPATKLQNQAQKDSNAQMNQLLQPVKPQAVPVAPPPSSKLETLQNFTKGK